MKKVRKILVILLALALCLSLAGCKSREEREREAAEKARLQSELAAEAEAAMERLRAEQIADDVLSRTPAIRGWAPSVLDAINMVFHHYDRRIEIPEKNTYIVTFSGSYCPNRSIPNLAFEGEVSYRIVVSEKGDGSTEISTSLYSDPNRITDAFYTFIIL